MSTTEDVLEVDWQAIGYGPASTGTLSIGKCCCRVTPLHLAYFVSLDFCTGFFFNNWEDGLTFQTLLQLMLYCFLQKCLFDNIFDV